MKKSFFVFFKFSFFMHVVIAQNPLSKQWDKRFGGTITEHLSAFIATRDGGFLLAGNSSSYISGDKTQDTWGYFDYWIIKLDHSGNKQWDRDFGGMENEQLYAVEQTPDGGYIIGGSSRSDVSGDKTQPTQGGYDYWIVKTDSLGNKQWDKSFGGQNEDMLHDIHQTLDGGYLLGGISNSPISGDKTGQCWGGYDYWIVKINSAGIKQWDLDLGGTMEDLMFSFQPTIDSGFILGGYSNSGISGDKTHPLWSAGFNDYWIVKIDSNGVKQWDKDFGSMQDEYLWTSLQTKDGGYLFAGMSSSGIGGDKTQSTWGGWDCWILKTDAAGNKQWDKDFGGTWGDDFVGSLKQTSDNGYLLSLDSYSDISGNKSENNLGYEQTWVLKLDSSGNLEWDKTIFTSGHDEEGLSLQTIDGCFAIAVGTSAGVSGYKTEPNRDNTNNTADYWVVKFCDSTIAPVAAFTSANQICAGTCTDFINLSSPAISYQWIFTGAVPTSSNDMNPQNICYATPGSYDVSLIVTSAIGSDTLLLPNYINVFPYPAAQGITQSGDTLFAIAGATAYQWYFNGSFINGATNYFYVATTSGDYNLVATDGNGCEVEAAVFNVIAGLTPALSKGEGVMVFPNPAQDKLKIQIHIVIGTKVKSESASEISLYSALGEKISLDIPSELNGYQSFELNIQALSSGMYFLEIISSGKTFRSKFVKQ